MDYADSSYQFVEKIPKTNGTTASYLQQHYAQCAAFICCEYNRDSYTGQLRFYACRVS